MTRSTSEIIIHKVTRLVNRDLKKLYSMTDKGNSEAEGDYQRIHVEDNDDSWDEELMDIHRLERSSIV